MAYLYYSVIFPDFLVNIQLTEWPIILSKLPVFKIIYKLVTFTSHLEGNPLDGMTNGPDVMMPVK